MTVVLPAPVASFRASRESPGLPLSFARSSCSRKLLASRPSFGATSVSQMMASAASIWQKNGRMSANRWLRQCFKSLAVSGVTRHLAGSGIFRHSSTLRRRPLMKRHQLVLLALGLERACGLVEAERLLGLALGGRDRGEERGLAAFVHDLAGRLSRGVELPVP